MAFWDNIRFPFFTNYELNLDWLLTELKRIAGFMPQDGNVGDILTRKSDGAAWEPPEAVNININALPQDTEMTDSDKLIFYDVSAQANRKITAPDMLDSMCSNGTPLMDGTASAGTSKKPARYDHKHPTDTSRQAALSGEQMNAVNSGAPANSFNNAGVLKAANGGAPADAFDASGLLGLANGGLGADNADGARANINAADIVYEPIYIGSVTSGKKLTFSGSASFLMIANGGGIARQGIYVVYGVPNSSPVLSPALAASSLTVVTGTGYIDISSSVGTYVTLIPLSSATKDRISVTDLT